MQAVTPIRGDEEFHTSTETLTRFLRARDWDLVEAEKMLKATVEWRRKHNPLHMECLWCHENPGYHGIRQVGFDECGRPVIYACFNQARAMKPTAEDTIAHCTYLIENAKRTMAPGVGTWVFIMDCSGMSLPACNPRLGYGTTQVFANYYPERLGLVICIHHNALFQGVWNAFKIFLHPNTVAKMHLLRSKKKVKEEFEKLFSPELNKWLLEEIKLNKKKPLVLSQREFWRAPEDSSTHDPRGCASYVAKYVEPFLDIVSKDPHRTHRPHPNIVDTLAGVIKPVLHTSESINGNSSNAKGAEAAGSVTEDADNSGSEGEEHGAAATLDIAEEFQIPKNVTPVTYAQ